MEQITQQMKTLFLAILLMITSFMGCNSSIDVEKVNAIDADLSLDKDSVKPLSEDEGKADFDTSYQTIHIFVALCDNKYQGIVPVPKAIGNGQDPNNNLYWGCGYGIRTYFKRSAEWKFVKSEKKDSVILERIIFKHATKKFYLIADAYNGKHIEKCTRDFFKSTSGANKSIMKLDKRTIGTEGNSSLCAYIGHNGLMDFRVEEPYASVDGKTRDAIILACLSKKYFGYYMHHAKANPLVWTTNFMAPEAYTIHDALSGYVKGETNEQIRSRAALAYAKYQKCGTRGARGLLVTGY